MNVCICIYIYIYIYIYIAEDWYHDAQQGSRPLVSFWREESRTTKEKVTAMGWRWSPGKLLAALASFSGEVMELMCLEGKYALALKNWGGESFKKIRHLWRGCLAGADDNSFLVVYLQATFFYNKSHLLNRDFQWEREMEIATAPNTEWRDNYNPAKEDSESRTWGASFHIGVNCQKMCM